MTKVCSVEPSRAIVYENGIQLVKPCGVKYTDKHEVYCKKFAERNCEYMLLKNLNQDQIEEYLLKDLGG